MKTLAEFQLELMEFTVAKREKVKAADRMKKKREYRKIRQKKRKYAT